MEYSHYNLIAIWFIIDSIVIFLRKQDCLSFKTFRKIYGALLHTWIDIIRSMDK